ncbi:MAG: hypothetical protein ACU4EQ_07285 [Candidatus Nitrosoglobus sp.]
MFNRDSLPFKSASWNDAGAQHLEPPAPGSKALRLRTAVLCSEWLEKQDSCRSWLSHHQRSARDYYCMRAE